MTSYYTAPSDMVKITPIFDKYFVEASTILTNTYNSGLVNINPAFNQFVSLTGGTLVQPFYNAPSSAAQVLGSDLETKKFTTGQRRVISIGRADAFAVQDISQFVSKDDPFRTLANDMAQQVVLERQRSLISILKGISAVSAFSSANVYNAYNSSDDYENISNAHILNAKGLLGDQQDKLQYILMHSAVYNVLQKLDLITTIKSAENDVSFDMYMGFRVVKHDQVPKETVSGVGVVYDTYLYAPGFVDMGIGAVPGGAAEMFREPLPASGRWTAIWRDITMMAPTGFSFIGTPSAQFPTSTELATASNWSMIFDQKNVPLVVIKSLAA